MDSDTDQQVDILVLAIGRAFTGLQETEAPAIAAALRCGKVCFGAGELKLGWGFDKQDQALTAWLADMGDWRERLLDTIDPRVRSLEWRNNFLYVYRTT